MRDERCSHCDAMDGAGRVGGLGDRFICLFFLLTKLDAFVCRFVPCSRVSCRAVVG
jgi:hypothetical protein